VQILIMAPWKYFDAAELFMARGFSQLGHQVFKARNLTVERVKQDYQDIDITLVYQGLERRWQNLADVEGLPGNKKAVMLMDNYLRFQDRRSDQGVEFAAAWDFIFHAHHSPLEDDPRVQFLPVAFDPETHYWDGEKEQKTIDVCFIGTAHPSRMWMANERMMIYGNDWGPFHEPIYGERKRKEIKHVKINLNAHFPGDTVNMRQFEILAMHGFLLTDSGWSFIDGKEVAVYDGKPLDYRKQVAYWLEDENERERIAEAGYKAVQPHTYKERAKELLKVMGF